MGRGLPPGWSPAPLPLPFGSRPLNFRLPSCSCSPSRYLRPARPRPGPRCSRNGGGRGSPPAPSPPQHASPVSPSTWRSRAWAAAAGRFSHAWRCPRASACWTPTGAPLAARRGRLPEGGALLPVGGAACLWAGPPSQASYLRERGGCGAHRPASPRCRAPWTGGHRCVV